VRNYTVEPVRVRPGQEFLVTIEIYNNGSRAAENALAIFPGDPFLPVGEPGHTMGQIHINHVAVVAQTMRAPSSLGPGVQQLTVNLGANDWEGTHYDYVQQIPVEVVGRAGASVVVGKPRIVVERADTEPVSLTPGGAFTLTLQLANRGKGAARDILAEVADSDTAIMVVGANTHAVDTLKIDERVTVTLPLLLGEIEHGGRQVLPLSLTYTDGAGAGYTDQELVVLQVDAELRQSPQLVIAAGETEPDFLTPGDVFTLTITLLNVGGGNAERLTLSLGGEGGAYLEPLIPLGGGNVLFIDRLEAGASTEVSRQLIVDGSAETKAYNLPIGLSYDDERGMRHEDVQRLSIVVRRRPELQATFYREPESVTVGSASALSVELINVGTSAVNVVALTASSPQMVVEAEGTPFIGPVEMGGSAPLDVVVTPRQAGPAELVISAAYRDDFNQVKVLTRTLTLEVAAGPDQGIEGSKPMQPAQPAEEAPRHTLWRAVMRAMRGFLGFGS
jgi:hypothetical protein